MQRIVLLGLFTLCLLVSPTIAQTAPPSARSDLSRRELQNSGATDADIAQLDNTIADLSRLPGQNRTALEGLAVAILRAERGLPFSEYIRRFASAAPRLVEAINLLEALEDETQSEGNSVAARLLASARTALDRGDLDGAEATLRQARSITRPAASRARSEDARIAGAQAQLRMLVFDFIGAARFYGEAADSAPTDAPMARASYLGARAQAFWAAFQENGDRNAGLQSIDAYQMAAAVALPHADRLVNYQIRSELCASQAILANEDIFSAGPTRQATLAVIERTCSNAALEVAQDPTYSSTLMEMKIVRNLGTARALLAMETRDLSFLRQANEDFARARYGFEQLQEFVSAADASFELAQLAYQAASELNIDAEANLELAIEAARYGLRLIDGRTNSLIWRRGQHTLAVALRYSAANGRLENLEPSIAAFRTAIAATSEDRAPAPVAQAWLGLAIAYEIGAGAGRSEMRAQAIEAARNAKRLGLRTTNDNLVRSADAILTRLRAR